MKEISDMTINELSPYIRGIQTLEGKVKKSLPVEEYRTFMEYLSKYPVVKGTLDTVTDYNIFLKMCPDILHYFNKTHIKELFYAAKLGFYYVDIPSDWVYLIKLAYDKYQSPNMVIKQLKPQMLEAMFKAHVSLYTVICNLAGTAFQLLDNEHLRCKFKDHTEVYLPREDAIILLANDMSEALTDEDIRVATNHDGICSNSIRWSTINGRQGITEYYYDLRNAR